MTATTPVSAVRQVAEARTPFDAVITIRRLGLNLTPPQMRELADAIKEMNPVTIQILSGHLLLIPARTPARDPDDTAFSPLTDSSRRRWLNDVIAELNDANEELTVAAMTEDVEERAKRNWDQTEHEQTHERRSLGPLADLGRGPGLTNLLIVGSSLADYLVDRRQEAGAVVEAGRRLQDFARNVVAPPEEILARAGSWFSRIISFFVIIGVFFWVVAFAVILKLLSPTWDEWNKLAAALVFGLLFGAAVDFIVAIALYAIVHNIVLGLVHHFVPITNPRVQEEHIIREIPVAMARLRIANARQVIRGRWLNAIVKQLLANLRLEGFVRQLYDQDVDNITQRFFNYIARHNIEFRPDMDGVQEYAMEIWRRVLAEDERPPFWVSAYDRMVGFDQWMGSTVASPTWWGTLGERVITTNVWLGDHMRSSGERIISTNVWLEQVAAQFRTQHGPRIIKRTARVMRWAGGELDRLWRRYVRRQP